MALPPNSLQHEKLFSEVNAIIRDYLIKCADRNSKVVEFKSPSELKQLVDLEVREEGESVDTIISLCRTIVDYSIHTAHPRFYNQLWSGVDEVGMLGLFLTAATNTSMYTFEMAPVYSLMEAEVLKKMRELIGWSHGDGIFAPGGSISNLYGLLAARYHKFPETKTKGIVGLPPMVLFGSQQSHYSVLKSAIIMGIGMDQVIKVKCDSKGRLIPDELDKAITEAQAKGQLPLAVVGTAATTVLGAFDPIDGVADVCAKHDVWLHIDGALGASALMSRTHRGLLAGIERADSVTWNPHKSLGVPLQCSAFLIRHEGVLSQCNSTKASYLFQQDKLNYDVTYDTGDKSIQCGRLNDVLKFWLMWKEKGTSGFERHIDRSIRLARYLADKVKEREGFELVAEPEYTNVGFWYIPPCLRQCTDEAERRQRLGKVAPIIKARMVGKGSMMIGFQPLGELPNFIRMTVATPHATEEDMDFILDEAERLGKDAEV